MCGWAARCSGRGDDGRTGPEWGTRNLWRDPDGVPHGLSASCTHKGCTVTWNNADKTWDCPCHGSIYEPNGAVIHGPTRKPLPARQL